MKKILAFLILILILGGCGAKKDTLTTVEIQGEEVTDINTVDNKGSGWGFKKEKGKKPDIPKDIIDNLAMYDAFFMDNKEEKIMYLTFDEGYEAGYTNSILDTLKKCEAPAAFFITGDYFDREPELVQRMHSEGHIIGNHTEHHPNLHKLSDYKKMQEEFKTLDDKYYDMFGEHMKYMRPPEGEYSSRVLAAAKDAGYKTVFWSFAYKDWLRDNVRGAQYAKESVVPYFHNGAILLLHAVSKDNADALEEIICAARESGFSFGKLDDIN